MILLGRAMSAYGAWPFETCLQEGVAWKTGAKPATSSDLLTMTSQRTVVITSSGVATCF